MAGPFGPRRRPRAPAERAVADASVSKALDSGRRGGGLRAQRPGLRDLRPLRMRPCQPTVRMTTLSAHPRAGPG